MLETGLFSRLTSTANIPVTSTQWPPFLTLITIPWPSPSPVQIVSYAAVSEPWNLVYLIVVNAPLDHGIKVTVALLWALARENKITAFVIFFMIPQFINGTPNNIATIGISSIALQPTVLNQQSQKRSHNRIICVRCCLSYQSTGIAFPTLSHQNHSNRAHSTSCSANGLTASSQFLT